MTSQGQPGIAAAPHLQCTLRPGERGCRWFLATAPPAVLTVLVALLGSLLLAAEARTQDLASDRAVLVALYNTTDGPNWKNKQYWLSDKPLGEWHGVTVHNGRVTRLLLGNNRLTGPLPSELGNLANLERLSLYGNRLTRSIPPELGDLANLEVLHLGANRLTGSIPPELSRLANLQELTLYRNRLTGPIPLELVNLANLEWLYLGNNQLTGPIPPELGNLANLQRLSLGGNQLTGPIPLELVNLANLQRLSLGGNQLTGPIPPELGNLANLEWLFLGGNQLTGPIPPELGNLANLEWLFLRGNQLTGFIPWELGNLTNLEILSINNTQLTGSIPPELAQLANLENLYLYNNRLTGSIPPELGNLAKLERLSLDDNQLTGSLPSELGSLAKLERLSLYNNQLTGSLPSELGSLANLEDLYLYGNQLTGTIPLSFANLVALRNFRFYLNPGLCAGADAVIQNWLRRVFQWGPDCSPLITLAATPSTLVEGSGPSPVVVTATRTAVSKETSVDLYIGGGAKLGESQDYTLKGYSGSFDNLPDALIIPAGRASGTTILTFLPRNDRLHEGEENIILQAFFGGSGFEGTAILSLNDRVSCAPGVRAALEALYHATGGNNWINHTNWLSNLPMSEWYGVTVDDNGCVTRLDLSNNLLAGSLPSRMGDLVNLEVLDLSNNYLTGIIPASLTNLAALNSFRFHGNSGLCAQADTSMRNWLNGVGDVRGLNCSSPESTFPLFVPVLLTSAGRNNSFFTSELTLTNRGTEPATLHYTYTAHAGGGSGIAFDTLAPGRQRIEPDAIGYLRDLGIPIPGTGKRIGTLRVEVTGSPGVSVVTRTATDIPDGRAGLAYPGITEQEGLQEPVYLSGLRQNSQDRSNVALQNMGAPGDGPITLRTTLFSGQADDITVRLVGEETLPPGGFHQYSGLLDRLGTPSQGYAKVEKVSGNAPFYAYGVINDNFNSDGSFVFPVTESSLVGTSGQTLPVIIETGAFQSELTVTNFSALQKRVDFSFVADAIHTAGDTATFSLKLKAGEQRILPELVGDLRREGVAGIGPTGQAFVGPLFAAPAEGDMSGVVIGARTGSPDGKGGQFGVFYNGVSYGAASIESAWIYGLQQNEENRSNLALVNTGEIDNSSITLEITIYDGDGQSQPRTKSVTLGPRRWTQEDRILGQISQGYVHMRKTSGNNPFVAYGVINDGGRPGERSGDGAFLPARQ